MSPKKNPADKRLMQARARAFIASMEAQGYAPIPYRRWTRRFRAEGVDVVHGPVSTTRTGNWAPKSFVETLRENRRSPDFCALRFHRQVEEVVWEVLMRGVLMDDNSSQPQQAP